MRAKKTSSDIILAAVNPLSWTEVGRSAVRADLMDDQVVSGNPSYSSTLTIPKRRNPVIRKRLLLTGFLLLTAPWLGAQQTKLLVTVFDEKTGESIRDLGPQNFLVVDDKTTLRVAVADFVEGLVDAMVLVDTSMVGEVVRPLAAAFVEGLGEKEQMALVSYHSSADLIQDFTSSKPLLFHALRQVRYGNQPRVLDALYAALDGGFQNTAGRRVVVLLSAGVESRSRSSLAEVLGLARRRNVSIFSVYVSGADKGLFRRLALGSGGAFFGARKLKLQPKRLSELVYSVLRGHYVLELHGVYRLGDRVEVAIQGLPKAKRKIWAATLPLE